MAHDDTRASATFTTEALAPVGALHLVLERFRLRVLDGHDRGRVLVSSGARTLVGTDAKTDLTLTDPTVSRFHCELVVANGVVTVRDLDSKNGTVVSGVAVREARLDPEATLRLGNTQLRFEPVAEA